MLYIDDAGMIQPHLLLAMYICRSAYYCLSGKSEKIICMTASVAIVRYDIYCVFCQSLHAHILFILLKP